MKIIKAIKVKWSRTLLSSKINIFVYTQHYTLNFQTILVGIKEDNIIKYINQKVLDYLYLYLSENSFIFPRNEIKTICLKTSIHSKSLNLQIVLFDLMRDKLYIEVKCVVYAHIIPNEIYNYITKKHVCIPYTCCRSERKTI